MLILVQRPQHTSTSDPVGAPKNNPFGAIFIECGDTKKCCTFSDLELVPKGRTNLIGALSCIHKGQKCIGTIRKKLLLLKPTKNARYVRSLGKNHLSQKAEESLLALSAACTRVQNTFKPSGTIRKKFLMVNTPICLSAT